MFRQLHFAGLFNAWGGDLWPVQSVKSKKLLKLSKKGCTFGRKRDNFKIGIQSVIHLYGIFSGLNTKKQENQGFRKNGWFPFAPTRKFKPSQMRRFSFFLSGVCGFER